jgi:hypothetical protein
VYTAKIERQYHLRRWEKERLARAAANVWVYRGAVYSTKGTIWSGSPLWKKAQW